MMAPPLELKVSDVLKKCTVTIHVKGLAAYRFRKWLGLKVMVLGAKIVGIGKVEVEG